MHNVNNFTEITALTQIVRKQEVNGCQISIFGVNYYMYISSFLLDGEGEKRNCLIFVSVRVIKVCVYNSSYVLKGYFDLNLYEGVVAQF